MNSLYKTIKEVKISGKIINVTQEDIFKYIKSTDLILEETEIESLIKKIINNSNLRGGYVLYHNPEFDYLSYSIIIDNTILSVNKKIFNYLKNSTKIGLLLSTAGEYISELIEEYKKNNDLLKMYIVDVIGSIIVEKCADHIHKLLKEDLKTKTTNRYSPGYCNWDTTEQFKIFELLPRYFCNIKLNSSGVMIPLKSISAIVGLGEKVKYVSYNCNSCGDINCLYKKI